MDFLALLAVLLVFAIPFFLLGWWLIRTSRSIDRLAAVMNENNANLGEIRIGQRTQGWLLFADVRFVLFLVRRRYRHLELPSVVSEALEKARTDYLTIVGIFTVLTVVVFAVVLYEDT